MERSVDDRFEVGDWVYFKPAPSYPYEPKAGYYQIIKKDEIDDGCRYLINATYIDLDGEEIKNYYVLNRELSPAPYANTPLFKVLLGEI